MKRALKLLLVLAFACLLFGTMAVPAMAAGDVAGEDLFTYEILDDGTISITGCSATGDIVIPSQIDGRDVTNLKYQLFYGNGSIVSVTIPDTVKTFGAETVSESKWAYCFSYCRNLQSIVVDENNPNFMSDEGVLYDKEQTTLINYPCGKQGTVYHVPATVQYLACTSFADAQYLQRLYLDGKNTRWYTYTFYGSTELSVRYLPGGYSEMKALSDIEDGRAGSDNWYASFELSDSNLLPDVKYHSQEDIRSFAKEHPFKNASTVYETEPSFSVPYSAGILAEETLTAALNALNFVRYTAGLDADVVLDDEYTSMAQAGVLVNAANNEMSHYPGKPDGMDDSLYELGRTGTSSSNLGWGYPTLVSAIFDGWMDDGDSSNIDRVGHRRWVLNPSMKATGFGMAGSFSAMYAFDRSGSNEARTVVWPAQNMPVEYFSGSYPWSISFGYFIELEEVLVKLVRQDDGKEWSFASNAADGYFNVDNQNYGQKGCIIFRPDGIDQYSDGDSFEVIVSMSGETILQYYVDFFYFNEHDLYYVFAEEPTCKEDGHEEYWACTRCDKIFGDEDGEKELDPEDIIIEATGHTIEVIKGKEATCTEDGLTDGSRCSVCGEILEEQEIIEKKGHKKETIPGKEATCTEEGLTDGSKCSVCGEILKEQETIAKKAHEYGDWEIITPATRTKDGKKERTCDNCGKTETAVIPAEGNLFNDVKDPGAWFYDKVYEIAGTKNQNGTPLMSGYKDGSGNFGPADPLTRQDFAVILYRLANEPKVAVTANPFPDADKGGYYYNSILWAKEYGVINGYEDGCFGVGDNITREQVATILYRYAKDYLQIDISTAKKAGKLDQFKDHKAVSPFAEDALTWASGAGIITGKDNGTRIDPQGNAARAEIGTMILRFIEYQNP